MTRNMQQEGVGLVFLARPASLVRSPVLPCVEAPLGESVVPLVDAGGRKTHGCPCAVGGRGGRKTHGCRWKSCVGRGWKGLGWRLVLCDLPVSAELMTIRKQWCDEGGRSPTLAFGRVPQWLCSRLLP